MNMSLRMLRLLICLAFVLCVVSCGGHTTRVIDTPETRELPGWQKTYEVDGLRYQPLRDYRGFKQRGVASWYGRKFHGRKTSNGEVYDMHGMSAAHKTLPMGVYVKVTHLESGREIVVRVNDRGPFVSGRIIDLSYGAAQKIGIVDSGTAKVRIQALGYRDDKQLGKTSGSVSGSYAPGSFAVQIGAFSSVESASQLAGKMRNSYGKATVSSVLTNGQQIHRVRVGHYSTLAQAEVAAKNFVIKGFSGSYVIAFD